MTKEKAQVILLTPVKNEEWIMDRFLKAASLWADIIIVADQQSMDKTREICGKYEKVRLIDNPSKTFNESGRQELLIKEARRIPGKKLLIALDADEFLTGNFKESDEWNQMLYAEEGTVFTLPWPCIYRDFAHYWWTEGNRNTFAMMDDGSHHTGQDIHSVRVPMPEHPTVVNMKDIAVMHFQYTDWERMKCKNLWYQCYERIHHPEKSVMAIYRMYHHMDVQEKLIDIPESWWKDYLDAGISLQTEEVEEPKYWWTSEIDQMVAKYGKSYFAYIDFPDQNNNVLFYLRNTQFMWKNRLGRAFLRRLDKVMEHSLLSQSKK